MGNLKTPIIRPLRSQGGTFYTFASAVEDIGLNIAERKNKVRLSHYAILDIPDTDENNINENKNKFNFYSCPGAFGRRFFTDAEDNNALNLLTQSCNQSLAQSFMSYALNMETAIINNSNYDYSTSLTVSERVFWKWLKESGAIRWYKDENGYLREGDINDNIDKPTNGIYTNVVKAIGKIDGVSQRSSDYGMYNEVYVNIPAAFGTSHPIIFKEVNDNNYSFMNKYESDNPNLIGKHNDFANNSLYNVGFYDYSDSANDAKAYYKFNTTENVIWSDEYAKNITDNNINMYLTDNKVTDHSNPNDLIEICYSSYDDNLYPNYKFLRSKYDCMTLDILLNSEYYTTNNIDYDTLSTSVDSNDYEFNAILVYYSIYDNADNILATNLYGVYFIDAPKLLEENKDKSFNFKIPRLNKVKSNIDGFGTSYSFRLNMRTSSIYDNENNIIEDNSSSENSIINDFNNVIAKLNDSIKLLSKNTKHTYILTEKYNKIYNNVSSITQKLNKLNNNVNTLLQTTLSDLDVNSITTNELTLNDSKLNINTDNTFNININSNDIIKYDNADNEINIIPTINISNATKRLNISNTSTDDANIDLLLKNNNIFDYIKIVPKSSENNNTYDLLDIEIRNDVDIDATNFAIKDQKIDIITLLAYILHKIK